MQKLYLEDLHIGQQFRSSSVVLSAQDIIRFARDNDPQFFHVDEVAARDSIFGGLIASGWQTGALTIRLLLVACGAPFAGGVVGAEADIAWKRPVRPGDALRMEGEVIAIAPAQTRRDRGYVSMDTRTYNQRDEIVQTLKLKMMVFRDPARRPA